MNEKTIADMKVTINETEEKVKIKKKNIRISPIPITSLKLFFKIKKE